MATSEDLLEATLPGARVYLDLPLLLDRAGPEPLNAQLTGSLREAMREGRLTAGERLPSSRALAATLAVSRTVVMEAYEQLYAEGWLEGRHGSGTYVADITPMSPISMESAPPPAQRPVRPMVDLRPGVPWVGGLNTPEWRRAWRLAGGVVPETRPNPWGTPGLRAALADYMRRGRGVGCAAERVVVTRGVAHGLDMVVTALTRPGDRIGVEEPGWERARTIPAARGAEIVPCPVDEHGLIVDRLPDGLRLIHTTPSHQYPLGGVLPVPRRQALLAWARRTGALIVEDDYDSEFRYDVAPLPALYGLDPEVVIYLGTMSKILTPETGIGWLVARPDLAAAVVRRREELVDRTSAVAQEAIRVLLDRGDLDRYVRRMRAEYARRRAIVGTALAGLPTRGDTAGLHLVVELPAAVTEYVLTVAAREGFLLDSIARHYTADRHYTAGREVSGLVIGYGAADVAGLRRGCSLVAELVASHADGGSLRRVNGSG